ncbi:MAG TPA: carbohydrate binding domain-containing protein [Verrucomicrobiae bacterium]
MKNINKIIGCSAAVAAVVALGAFTTQAQNLLVNGSFENAGGFTANPVTTTSGPGGTTGVDQGWAAFGAAQSDMSSALNSSPESGSYSLLAQNGPGNNWNPQGAYQIVDGIVAGQTYNLSAYYLIDSSSANTGTYATPFAEQINFGNLVGGTWTTVGTSTATFGFGNAGATDGAAPSLNTWYQETGSLVAPAGASEAEVYMFYMDNGQTTVDQMYIDNASLVAAPEPSTLALAGLGGLGVLMVLIRRRQIA